MTNDDTQRAEEIARKIHEITVKAIEDGADPGDIFTALECMFSYWLAFVSDSDRERALREHQQRIPEILKHANETAANLDADNVH